MKICIPSRDERGLQSEIHDHFGSAPWFTIVDTETSETDVVSNPSCHQSGGSCHQVGILQKKGVEAVVTSGMGHRAWSGLQEAQIQVLSAPARSVGELVKAVESGKVSSLSRSSSCEHGHSHADQRDTGRGHRHGCGHR